MAQSTLKEINDAVFNFLMERHYQAKEQGKPDSFLFVMATDEARLKQGFWLPGDEDSVWVSFLTRNGRESAVYIRIEDTVDSPVSLVLRSSEQLDGALKLAPIAHDISLATALNLSPENFDNTQYNRKYQSTDYLAILEQFIVQEKEEVESTVLKYTRLLSDKSFSVGQSIELKQFYEQFNRVQQKRLPDKLTLNWSKKGLPNALNNLYVRNFRGIKICQIDHIPSDTKWIFVTGENGFGKSSILQAIAVGLWGLPERVDRAFSDATIECVFLINNTLAYNDISYQTYTFSSARQLEGHIAAYGSSRLQTSKAYNLIEPVNELSTLYHLFNNNGALLDVNRWLTEMHDNDKNQFNKVVELFKEIIPNLHSIKINYNRVAQFSVVQYFEKDENGKRYKKSVSFKNLASGFQNIIGLVADMLRRLNSSSLTDFKRLRGIVIIDELELHLHPKLQRELPHTLSRLFPNIQFVTSTHSPIPLLGAPKESIVLTVYRTEEAGITVERLDVDFSKLLPNSILTSPIFGFDDIIPESAPSIAEVETEDSYDEVLANQQLKKKLGILKAKLNEE